MDPRPTGEWVTLEAQSAPDAARCELHEDREAVGRCRSCGRATCLECAIPVRGEIVCTTDAADELGAPAAAVALPPRAASRWIVALFAIGFLATIPPWHRFGILTGVLSSWGVESGPWPPLAAAGLAAGGGLSAWSRTGRRPWVRPWARWALATAAGLCILISLVLAPAFVSPSPAPFVALACAAGAALGGLFGVRRRGTAKEPRRASP